MCKIQGQISYVCIIRSPCTHGHLIYYNEALLDMELCTVYWISQFVYQQIIYWYWILHSYQLDDLLRSSESIHGCSVQKILEGIFIFQLINLKEKNDFNSEIKNKFNPYADLLYDSVRALISSVDNSSFSYFNESSSPPYFSPDSSKVYIYHNLNGTASLTGIYDGTSHTLNVSEITFIDYNLPRIHKEPLLSPYLLSLPILCFLFNILYC